MYIYSYLKQEYRNYLILLFTIINWSVYFKHIKNEIYHRLLNSFNILKTKTLLYFLTFDYNGINYCISMAYHFVYQYLSKLSNTQNYFFWKYHSNVKDVLHYPRNSFNILFLFFNKNMKDSV